MNKILIWIYILEFIKSCVSWKSFSNDFLLVILIKYHSNIIQCVIIWMLDWDISLNPLALLMRNHVVVKIEIDKQEITKTRWITGTGIQLYESGSSHFKIPMYLKCDFIYFNISILKQVFFQQILSFKIYGLNCFQCSLELTKIQTTSLNILSGFSLIRFIMKNDFPIQMFVEYLNL